MTLVLAYVVELGPLIVLAALLGAVLAGYAPWVWRHPERWLLWAILVLAIAKVGDDSSGEGSLFRQVTWGGLFLFAGLRALVKDDESRSPVLHSVPVLMWCVLAYAFTSILWSPIPLTSFKRALQLLGVLLLALIILRGAEKGQPLQKQLRAPALIVLLAGLLAALVSPSLAFDADRALRGISSHKNTWGQLSLLACITLGYVALTTHKRRGLTLAALGVAIASLALSRSATSLMGLFLVAGVFIAARLMVAKNGVLRVSAIGAALVVLICAHAYVVYTGQSPIDPVVEAIYATAGKEQTLTGRTQLWQLMDTEIARHRWFGIGYGGFWAGPGGPSNFIAARVNWGPPGQAHSGYIDVTNELGYAGMALLAALLLRHAGSLIQLYRRGRRLDAGFHAALLSSALIINYAESSLLRTTHVWWIVLCASIVEVHRANKIPKNAGAQRAKHVRATPRDWKWS
ncbi:MAG: O-antigen ligase family protein [Hyphomonadaceae bacterium]